MTTLALAKPGHGGALGEDLPFENVCRCCEALTRPQQGRAQRVQMISKLWDDYAPRARLASGEFDLFPLMRLLLPHLDTERAQYRAKQKNLARWYVDILAINEASEDAQTLLNWKRPSAGFQRNEQGNFPEVVRTVIEGRVKRRADVPAMLTVGELNEQLDALAAAEETEKKRDVLRVIISRTTAREQRWILRVIIKDMQIGMKEDSIFNLYHPDAKELHASVVDLRKTLRDCACVAARACVWLAGALAVPCFAARRATLIRRRPFRQAPSCARVRQGLRGVPPDGGADVTCAGADPSFRHDQISLSLFVPLKPRLAERAQWKDVCNACVPTPRRADPTPPRRHPPLPTRPVRPSCPPPLLPPPRPLPPPSQPSPPTHH